MIVLPPTRVTRLVFISGLVVWIANALIQLISGYVLGHDESQYAIAARDMLAGSAPRWFYVSNGMNAIAAPGVLAGGSEPALRVLPLLFGIAFVLATWQLARRTFGDAVAAWTVAVVAGSRFYVRCGVELLSDMPAAACLIGATAIIVGELGRGGGPRWRLVIAAPLLAAALYIRYGSCVPIAIVGALSVVFGWRTIASRPQPVLVTAAVFIALLAPHAVNAIRITGSPFGVLLQSAAVPPHRSMIGGLVTYVASNPIALYGVLPVPVMIAGLLGLRRDRKVAVLWLAAILDIGLLGMITQAQTRYIFFGTALLVILGTAAIHRAIAAQPARVRAALGVIAIAAIGFGWMSVTIGSLRHRARRAASNRALLAATAAIERDLHGDLHGSACHVFGASCVQVEWYTGCSSREAPLSEALERREPTYGVTYTGESFDPLPGRHRVVLDTPGVVRVVRIDAAAP